MMPGTGDTEAGGHIVEYSMDTGARNQQQRLRVGEQPRRAWGGWGEVGGCSESLVQD